MTGSCFRGTVASERPFSIGTLGKNLADENQPNKMCRAENLQQKIANSQDRLPASWPAITLE